MVNSNANVLDAAELDTKTVNATFYDIVFPHN